MLKFTPTNTAWHFSKSPHCAISTSQKASVNCPAWRYNATAWNGSGVPIEVSFRLLHVRMQKSTYLFSIELARAVLPCNSGQNYSVQYRTITATYVRQISPQILCTDYLQHSTQIHAQSAQKYGTKVTLHQHTDFTRQQ